jgi:hypothetical protein
MFAKYENAFGNFVCRVFAAKANIATQTGLGTESLRKKNSVVIAIKTSI